MSDELRRHGIRDCMVKEGGGFPFGRLADFTSVSLDFMGQLRTGRDFPFPTGCVMKLKA